MQFKDILKKSMLGLLICGSFVGSGCARDGKDGVNGKDGENGINGINGSNGKDGSTWLSGEGVPSNDKGNNGDFYLNFNEKKIYKKDNGEWIVVVDLVVDDEEENGIVAGKYVYEQTVGDLTIYDEFILNESLQLVKCEQITKSILEEGTLLSDMSLIPISVDGDNVVLDIKTELNSPVTLESGKIYNVNNEIQN